ncbi:MAG TPA: pyridoxal-dependent decarboxylase [Phototrophicaceae bacterium]|nr:pyridoxal-dependent decarboxylase [Phototrophicaceae bacterium]
MVNLNGTHPEETLDPEDWQAMRALGHQMVDDMFSFLQTAPSRPVWQPIPGEVREHFLTPVPEQPAGAEAAYKDFVQDVLPYPMGNFHPRFWGWVTGTGTPLGMLADMLAAAINPNLAGGDHAPNLVEAQVVDWCKQMLGYPPEASGLLVSGASMANLVGLTIARNSRAGYDVRKQGVQGQTQRLTVYGSKEMHSSIQRAVEILGLGSNSLRLIPVNDNFEMDLEVLKIAITADKALGYQPLCIVGCAGTVNTGAFDDLNTIADLCEREGIWFHVDGAFGAMAALAPALRHLTVGMERADSLAFDMHKWLYVPFEAACALVRHPAEHYEAFTLTADYTTHARRGAAAGEVWFSDLGLQLSRGFRALKVWMSLKEHGTQKYGRLIQQNVEQVRYLADLIDTHPELERLAPAPLNIVCFRYQGEELDDEALNQLNVELLMLLHESGVAVPSYTRIGGKYAIRVANTNHRSHRADFDVLVQAVVEIGRRLVRERAAMR